MLKYIFSALLIIAVWATVLLLQLPYKFLIGGLATALILIVLATIVIVRVMRAKKAAKEIERALRAQADAQAANARPDLRADIDAMQAEFIKAVQALKGSKLGGKRGAEALYALPWYMIIGPPGSGKSTALRNSGLRFPYMSKSGGAVQGVGGTRNCQWWMTNEAVILDTAGRYTTEEADRDEWFSFLDLLRKNRTKQPINGVMVAVPVTELAEAHPEEVLARAREIRARIDEVMSRLEMVVPVYVLFTKCDLLPGFVEIFADLGSKERHQIWGFTVPVTAKEDPATLFRHHFVELARGLERRMVRRLPEERAIEGRDKIFAFPQYFEPMRENLAIFVGELMAESIYTESPIFRGAYFTSGTQEGRPIDRIMNSMAEAFGVQPQMQMHAPHVEAKSYFLGEVFSRVIFPDRNVATRSAARLRRQALVGHAIAAGLFLLAAGMASLPLLSFRENRDLLVQTRDAVNLIEDHEQTQDKEPMPIEKIDPLRQVERRFAGHEESVPLLMRMGMYQGEKYGSRVRDLFVQTLRQEVIAPLHEIETEKLERFVQKYGPLSEEPKQEEQIEYRNRLRMYLLLTGPKGEREPGLDGTQKPWLNDAVTQAWNDRLNKLKLTSDVATMRSLVEAYTDRLAQDSGLLFARDKKLVASARKVLNRKDRTKALLDELLADVDVPDLSLLQLTDSRVAIKSDKSVLSGKFTREAWTETVRERLENPFDTLAGDEWVLGMTEADAEKSRLEMIEELKSLYFQEYISEWRNFIGAIYIEIPQDYLEAQRTFEDLTRGATPPLKRLAQYVYYHTNLPEAPEEEEEEAGLLEQGLEAGEAQVKKKNKKLAKGVEAGKKLLDKDKERARNPLLKTREDVRTEFEGLATFGYQPPPPAPEGGPAPPPPSVPLDSYQEELKRVRDAVRAMIDIGGSDEAKLLDGAIRTAKRTTEALINESDTKGWRPTLVKWLPPPFDAVKRMLSESSAGVLTDAYCQSVYQPLINDVFNRYPFVDKGKDLSTKTFVDFFQPGTGKIWEYYNSALAGRIPRKHGTFALAETGAAEQKQYNPALVDFLNRAEDLSKVMFPTGSDAMRVEFDVWIDDNPAAAITSFQIGDQKVEHKNGPGLWKRMEWPGENPSGASVQTRGQLVRGGVEREGEWGLFELLEKGTVTRAGDSDVFVVKWDLRDQDAGVVTIKFRPVEEDTPFFGTPERPVGFMEAFRNKDLLRPPRQLILGGTTCSGE